MAQWRTKGSAAVLCCLSVAAWAQGAPSAIRNPSDQLFREQAEREREQVLRQAPLPEQAAPAAEADLGFPEGLAVDGPSFQIDAIRADGDALLSAAQFERITAAFTRRQLGTAHIRVLLDRVTKALVAAGYVTSRAYVGNQNLQQGTLTISIQAGRIETILYNGQALRPGDWNLPGVRLALPMAQGDVLRLQDIEQAVDQLNRLRRNAVQVQIQPGEQAGGSIVDLRNREGEARQYSASADNQGSSGTGRTRIQASVEQGNGLGLMESISLGLTSSTDTNALYGTFSVPLGYTTLTGMVSWSEYQSLVGDTALVYGTSRNALIALNRLVARDQNAKTAIDLSLAQRSSGRAINNVQLTPQQLAVLRIGVNRLQRFSTAAGIGQWTLDAGWARGLKALGADQDAADLPSDGAHAQFDKFELSATAQMPVVQGISWRTRFASQWSRKPLFSSEQIFIGGVASVRGLPESAVGGDRGFYLRNEAAWDTLAPVWNNSMRLEPYAFLDGGIVRGATGRQRHQGAIGAGLGLRVAFAHGNADISVGRPLHRPAAVHDGGTRINASLTWQF
ncbi:ShlB/FhaC/HecB family hemolysin secretion/activation protein [Pseudorhodoferax sp.]|uniref:ShlB/FhaC/HecB family hemolysin secretion/activation protein n=1 Tax=Pseudorhodoferax sp. TaxID=1993553 RepID=UPI002DD6652A|nr:ShlB/FhaC/HecB family hemolysin secretion/activation protein [Pseudorhodoferax sp.]